MDNPLNNELLTSGLSQFDGTVDLAALQGVMDPSFNDQNGDGVPDHYNQELAPLHTNHRGYVGDDGALYRKEISVSPEGEVSREYTDERLYFWTPPQELGDAPQDAAAQEQAMAGPKGFGAAGLYTESEIKEAWGADEGMGYLKQHTDWDSYWNFIQKSTELFTDAEYNDMTDGNLSGGNWQESPEYMALLEETGIPTQFVNDDGDVFNFNGTTYVKDYKTDDSIGVDVINSVALGLIGGIVAGPLVAGALGPVMGTAAAKAASSAIINLASQYMTTGEVDFGDALISAATSYGGAKLGDALKGSEALGGIGDKISGVTDKFTEVLDKTGDIGSAAIKAGGMSLLTQMVTTGEIDVKQAGIAALMAGGTTAFQEWTTSMYDSGAELTSDDLQEIVVEAKRVGTDVGGGMTQLENGLVINDAGQIIGNMDDIDLDGDGMLSSNDLQEITTPPRDLVDPNPNDNVYGDVDLAPPDSTTNPTAFTEAWKEGRYDGMSASQIRTVMEREGFDDPEIDKFLDEEWYATSDLELQELNTASYGGIDVNMEDPYTIGQTDEGQYYIAKTDELTGEVSFKTVTEDQFNELYDRMYGYQGTDEFGPPEGYESALVSGDYSEVEQYLANESLVDGGNFITGGFDADGNPVGLAEGSAFDDWVTLEEGSFNNTAVPIDDFVEADPDPVEPVEPEPVDPVDTTEQDTTDNQTTSNVPTGGDSGSESPNGNAGTPGSVTDGVDIDAILNGLPDTNQVNPNNEVTDDLSNPLTGGPTVDDTPDVTVDVDPSNGTGTPVQTTNAQIEALMDRGMTYEEAVANQNAAISAGADADGDGMVTNAEWSAHTGQTGAGETISDKDDGSGDDVTGDKENAGDNGGDDLDPTGDPTNDGGTTDSTETGSNTTEGPGTTTDVKPGGGGPGPGPGTGPGTGPGMLGGGGVDNYTPTWGELFAYTTITPYQAKQLEPVRQHIATARGMLS